MKFDNPISQVSSLADLPAEIKLEVIYQLIDDDLPQTIQNIQNLAATNKVFHALINNPTTMKSLLETMAAHIDEVDELDIAYRMENMPGIADINIQSWLKQRTIELKKEKKFFNSIEENDEMLFDVLKETININARHKIAKMTPLILAIALNRPRMVQKLIDKNADVNLYDIYNLSPLLYAVSVNSQEIVQKLIDANADLNHKDVNGWDALNLAAHNGFENLAIRLVRAGANINKKINVYINKENIQSTPLKSAITRNFTKLFNTLLESKADVNISSFGQTPLMFTLSERKIDMFHKLLDAGAHINIQDDFGFTPLMYSIAVSHLPMMRELIARKASLDLQDSQGLTALMVAVIHSRRTMIKYLLDAGARVDIKSKEGKTALDYAKNRSRPNQEITDLLRSAN